jgi:hypothetical protein
MYPLGYFNHFLYNSLIYFWHTNYKIYSTIMLKEYLIVIAAHIYM